MNVPATHAIIMRTVPTQKVLLNVNVKLGFLEMDWIVQVSPTPILEVSAKYYGLLNIVCFIIITYRHQ